MYMCGCMTMWVHPFTLSTYSHAAQHAATNALTRDSLHNPYAVTHRIQCVVQLLVYAALEIPASALPETAALSAQLASKLWFHGLPHDQQRSQE